jgi:hypothetical protein
VEVVFVTFLKFFLKLREQTSFMKTDVNALTLQN